MTRGRRIPIQQAMVGAVSTCPPVGQVTQTEKPEFRFYAVLEVEQHSAEQPWQVALWHTRGSLNDEQVWEETMLLPCEGHAGISELSTFSNGPYVRLYFQADVEVQPLLRFTVKFRGAPDQQWRWIRDEHGVDDGIVVSAPSSQTLARDAPEDIIKNLNPALRVKSHISQSPGTQLWTLETTVKAADGDSSSFEEVEIGTPWGHFLR